jgi:3',5'-cyclic-AMP phosphodiesterase
MTEPFLLVQLSDPHIGAEWGAPDAVGRLAAAVGSVRALPQQPDAVLVSGDLADNATDAEYAQLRDLLALIDAPSYVLPGNHDDRDALHRNFGVPGADGEPVQYAADMGAVRLVVLDTTRPGEDHGELDADRLDWLEAELAAEPEAPTMVAMHHPPLSTGLPAMDAIGLPVADRRALGEVVQRHPHVLRLVGGHMHRTVAAELAGRLVLAAPSTYVQMRLDFELEQIQTAAEPAGFAVHALLDGELVSHVHPVA